MQKVGLGKFRPQGHVKSGAILFYLRGDSIGKYNWHEYPATRDLKGRKLKQPRWIFKFAGIVHHYTSHAPVRVNLRWKQAGIRWRNRLPKKASIRYSNTISIEKDI